MSNEYSIIDRGLCIKVS